MVDVERSLLAGLGQAAVLAAMVRANPDGFGQGMRDVRHDSVAGICRASNTEPKQRQHVGEVDEALSFNAFVVTEVFAAVLLVEQALQTLLNALGKLESRQFARELQSNIEGVACWFRHVSGQ